MDNNRENTSYQLTRVRSHTQSHAPLAAETCGSDSPGYVRQLLCSVLHQQAGLNKFNTAVQTDQEATPHVSGPPDSTPGLTHPQEIERPCKYSVTPFPDVRYRMVSTSICVLIIDTGMGIPLLDMFATRWNHKLPPFVSPVPDPSAMAVDALSMSWNALWTYT